MTDGGGSALEADYCVVGAGFAGLTAALRLVQAGRSVVVLEARERVGGRVWSERLADGTSVERGGAWVGVGQDRLRALADEMDVATYPTFTDGASLYVDRGRVHRYRGLIPSGMTQLGRVLRLPFGRVHWAGTETSPVWNGFIDGAVRSGERVAAEMLAADSAGVASAPVDSALPRAASSPA